MLSYQERAARCSNPTAKKLLELMEAKQTNLCLAADATTKKELLAWADEIGPEICLLKTHIDIITDFDWDLIVHLQVLAKKHNFLIFEDRKFADIGKTVQHQYRDGMFHMSEWADIVNTHTVAGPGSIEALKEIGLPKGRGLLLLAEMTPKGTLAKGEYTAASIKMAEEHQDFVIGFITTRTLSDNPCFINMTPGIQMAGGGDRLGQQYTSPDEAIRGGADVIIVGRGICAASEPLVAADAYREAGWEAYQARIGTKT